MARLYKMAFILLCLNLPNLGKAQTQPVSRTQDYLWLKVAHIYYMVIREGAVDQDSCLMLVSQKSHISRWPVVTEGFGANYSNADISWFERGNTSAGLKRLAASKGGDHTRLLLLLGAYYAFQPGYRKNDLDSALSFLEATRKESQAQRDTTLWNQSLCLLGKTYLKTNNTDKAFATFEQAIKNAQKSSDKALEAKAWDYQGTYCLTTPKTIGIKISSWKKAFELYDQVKDQKNKINCATNISYLSFLITDLKEAERYAALASELEKRIDVPVKHYTYDLLALIYAARGEHGKSMQNALAAVESAEQTREKFGLGYFYARVGHISSGYNKFQESLDWLKKALDYFTKNNGESADIYKVLALTSGQLSNLNRHQEGIDLLNHYLKISPPKSAFALYEIRLALAGNYAASGNYPAAEKNLILAKEAVERSMLVTKQKHNTLFNLEFGQLYYAWGKYGLAKKYLKLFVESPERTNSASDNTLTAYYRLYKIDSTEGNYASALNYHVLYSALKDSTRSEKQNQLIETLRVQYKTEQNQRDIASLTKEKTFEQERVAQTKKMAYGGFAGASIIILLLLNRYYTNSRQKLEMNKKNEQLQVLIKDKDSLIISKEWLLKEVHHRVKNNLHTVICLLESQAAYLKDDALKALEISQHRIYAMSLIHQKLYQSDDLKTVNMSIFIPEFMNYLSESFEVNKRIYFDLDIADIELEVAQAVPLSLILNEAVTNSIKYAFAKRDTGRISVWMAQEDQQVTMCIADDGVGIDPESLRSKPNSLGMKLIKGLSEDINAEFHIENSGGTKITLVFTTKLYEHLRTHEPVQQIEA
ncbi:ATP-binding protein [Dyadobacter sp. CY261]|uniref:tetratricopeptide repeat-containing sensor histidine kinase n=1 Tax=Dyadobacter sp. CY261 TaxID=2907203 RepID=UPI001F398A33|nr:histidine kinase dimerization/phosphoacceptor domain -containing protein [Dyadobacter sp. CY261]MCF0074236.1 ATP-binding protein [Dyadobacter sp. CY261]